MEQKLISAAFVLMAALSATANPVLQGMTSKPLKNAFYPQEKVVLSFTVSNLEPFSSGPDLDVSVVDDRDRPLKHCVRKVVADRHGIAIVNLDDVPCKRLGFYRVRAKLSDGTPLVTPWSTMRDGEMTYAVVRDPATREAADDAILRFYTTQDPDLVGPIPQRPNGAYGRSELARAVHHAHCAFPERARTRDKPVRHQCVRLQQVLDRIILYRSNAAAIP